MARFQINTFPEVPRYTMRLTLGDREYVLRLDYLGRQDRWILDILDLDEQPIRTGIRLTANVFLLTGPVDERLPRGDFVVETSEADESPPGWGELGADRRCQLVYWDRDELLTPERRP